MLAATTVCAVHDHIGAAIDNALTLASTISSAPPVGLRNTVSLLRERSTASRSYFRRSRCAYLSQPIAMLQSVANVAHVSAEILSRQSRGNTARANQPLIVTAGDARFDVT